MVSRLFQGGVAAWFDASSWSPAGIPVDGDSMTVNTGTVTISAADASNFGTLDAETLLLGGAAPAVLAADSASFGSLFTLTTTGLAALDLTGSIAFAGTLLANGDSLAVNGATFTDTGVIAINDGVLTFGSATTLQGTGTIQIGANGTLVIDGPVAPGLVVDFTADTGTLMLAAPAAFLGSVTGFAKGNVIDLVGAPSYDWTYSSTSDKLTILGGNSSQAPHVAKFALSGDTALSTSAIFVGQDGAGGSAIQLVDTRVWAGVTGAWYDASNWTTVGTGTTNSYPLFGDTAIINSGTATISAADVLSFGSLNNGVILLSGNDAAMQVAGNTLGTDLTIRAAGSDATTSLTFNGVNALDGRIQVTGPGSVLNFMVGNDGTVTGNFINNELGTILVGYQSSATFDGGRITNNGQILVNGAATIAAGTTIDGTGVIELNDSNGVLTIAGVVAAGQQIAFDDWNNLTIAAGAQFNGTIEDFEQGNTIDLAGVAADHASYDAGSSVLTLRNGGASGSIVATLSVTGSFGADDFQVQPDGDGGTDITTFGTGATTLYANLPLSAIIETGGTVSLESLLVASFGTSFVASLPNFSLFSESPADLQYFSYWDPNEPLLSYWTVNGTIVTPDNVQTIAAADLSGVSYVAGNAIRSGAQVQVPIAFDDLGNPTFVMNYWVENFAAPFAQPSVASGNPTPQDIVNAASAFAAAYTGVPNTEDCWNIAAEVAAAAGAVMWPPDWSTEPQQNFAAGFWRISYAAPQDGSAISNWSTLVQAGDILRIGWASNGGPHSFTVVEPLDASGSITVFDNVYFDTPGSYEAIGMHSVQYWTQTDPEDITIFRLDPNSLYLIANVVADGAVIPGTTFNDLIIPGGTAAIMTGAAGNDIFANVGSILNGATITDFHLGDTIDVTDLDSTTATVGYDAATGVLTLTGAGTPGVAMQLPTGLVGSFSITNDGGTAGLDGGTLGVLYDDLYAGDAAQGSVVTLVVCFAAGTHIATVRGEVAVEHLAIDDMVLCDDGRFERIAWIGYRHLDIWRHPHPGRVLPIRIAAGSFGRGIPRRDLLLSPDHAVFADGVLIPVRCLVNGSTIVQLTAVAMPTVTYYHVELPRHDVIRAEGLPVESYLDTGDRGRFSNAGEPLILHPDFATRIWEAEGCAPLRIVGPEVQAVRDRLARVAHRHVMAGRGRSASLRPRPDDAPAPTR